jgi:hypothetical protein
MKIQWEYDLIERPFCQQLERMGWQWIEGDPDLPESTEHGSSKVLLKARLAALRGTNATLQSQQILLHETETVGPARCITRFTSITPPAHAEACALPGVFLSPRPPPQGYEHPGTRVPGCRKTSPVGLHAGIYHRQMLCLRGYLWVVKRAEAQACWRTRASQPMRSICCLAHSCRTFK